MSRKPSPDVFDDINRELRAEGTEAFRYSDVKPERVAWLWPGRLALGKITLIDGDPGRGKSVLTVDMAARISTGEDWPDGARNTFDACPVVILSAEDGPGDTIRPRLDAAGADTSLVFGLDQVGEDAHPVMLPDDLDYIEAALQRHRPVLLIIDPLMAFLAADVNSYRDQDVRRALRPLAALADRLDVAVAVVRHPNKTLGAPAIYRGGGSIAFIGAARVGLVVGADPNDEELRILAPAKANLSKPPAALAYRLVEGTNGAVRVKWEGTSTLTADQLLATPAVEGRGDRSARVEAEEFLLAMLADGPVLAKQVKAEAGEAGVAERTLKRAKRDLGVVAIKDGMTGPWRWSLPEGGQQSPKGAMSEVRPPSPDVGPLRGSPVLGLVEVENHGHISWGFKWEGPEPNWRGHPPGLFASQEAARTWGRQRGFRVSDTFFGEIIPS